MKLVGNGKIEISIRDIIESLTIEEKHQIAELLVWDKEIFDEFVDHFAKSTVVTPSFDSWLYDARLRLVELLPIMNQEIIRSLLHELDSAKEEARRHRNWAYAMYHAWPENFRALIPKIEAFKNTPFRTDKEIEERKVFNFEEWLKKMTYWEDPDTQLIFLSTEDGGVSITDQEYRFQVEGKTLEEACLAFGKLARAHGEH